MGCAPMVAVFRPAMFAVCAIAGCVRGAGLGGLRSLATTSSLLRVKRPGSSSLSAPRDPACPPDAALQAHRLAGLRFGRLAGLEPLLALAGAAAGPLATAASPLANPRGWQAAQAVADAQRGWAQPSAASVPTAEAAQQQAWLQPAACLLLPALGFAAGWAARARLRPATPKPGAVCVTAWSSSAAEAALPAVTGAGAATAHTQDSHTPAPLAPGRATEQPPTGTAARDGADRQTRCEEESSQPAAVQAGEEALTAQLLHERLRAEHCSAGAATPEQGSSCPGLPVKDSSPQPSPLEPPETPVEPGTPGAGGTGAWAAALPPRCACGASSPRPCHARRYRRCSMHHCRPRARAVRAAQH